MKFLLIKLQAPGGILLRAIAGTYLPAMGGTHLSATGGTPRASRARFKARPQGRASPEAYLDFPLPYEFNIYPYRLDIDDDASWVNVGFNWRMPTKDEFCELIENCLWKVEKQDGHLVYKITSKINGNHIFLPLDSFGRDTSYWTSIGHSHKATALVIDNGSQKFQIASHFSNRPELIRPVLRNNYEY